MCAFHEQIMKTYIFSMNTFFEQDAFYERIFYEYIVIIIYQMSETKLQKPFIKWVGGKTQIIDKIVSKIVEKLWEKL